MPRTFRIRVKLQQLQSNMSKEERRPVDEEEIRKWLTDAGMRPCPDGTWLVDEPDLGHLDPSEVESIVEEPN